MKRTATTEQVADALHVKPATVRKYARERRLPFDVTPGGHRRFDVEEAVRAILGHDADRHQPAPGPDEDTGWELATEVPYVHVEPEFSVIVQSTTRASLGDAPVVVLDSPDDAQAWAEEYPVV